jgi:hypothetical protein
MSNKISPSYSIYLCQVSHMGSFNCCKDCWEFFFVYKLWLLGCHFHICKILSATSFQHCCYRTLKVESNFFLCYENQILCLVTLNWQEEQGRFVTMEALACFIWNSACSLLHWILWVHNSLIFLVPLGGSAARVDTKPFFHGGSGHDLLMKVDEWQDIPAWETILCRMEEDVHSWYVLAWV